MSITPPLRVMWLLNHTTARGFELAMLNMIGIREIFLPKSFPQDPSFRTASIDYSYDSDLCIPKEDLQILNETDWYAGASADIWKIANKYFDLVFLLPMNRNALDQISHHFQGAVVWRVYGRDRSANYDQVLNQSIARDSYGGVCIRRMGLRFYFGEAYSHLADIEPPYLRERRIYLPLGLKNAEFKDHWEGKVKQIYFVCPEIASSPIYHNIYMEFRSSFSDLPYVVAGAQPITTNDKNVLGYVSDEQHAYNMRQSRVMFYHSEEPNHVHYHPFEAIRAGMPLVFMAGGMLDRIGGSNLPGRCKNAAEARKKIERILGDDLGLIDKIRASQTVLLEHMRPKNCEPAWRNGLARIAAELNAWRSAHAARPKLNKLKRVAVIVPVAYRGRFLGKAFTLAKALYVGSRQSGEDADVVFAHYDDSTCFSDEAFTELPESISRRPFNWKILPADEARRTMRYAGFQGWEPSSDCYMVPDDGMRQLLDCDLWLFMSDRLSYPVLPLKPMVLMVFGYIQRYEDQFAHGADLSFISAARSAARVLVTTEFTRQDAVQYAGVEARRVIKVPMVTPNIPTQSSAPAVRQCERPYFTWTTSEAPHKNHLHSAEALLIYYGELEGQWDCKVTGVGTKGMLSSELPHMKAAAEVFGRNKLLRKRVKWMGDQPNAQYRNFLSQASFLWHAGRVDAGTFRVIEAACMGVPSLSSDYPAMREIDAHFSLNLSWMNPYVPRHMAEQLKYMELTIDARRAGLPTFDQLRTHSLENHARAYWQEVRSCL